MQNKEQQLGVCLPVSIVVVNMLAEMILLFITNVYTALQPGGIYIVSGIYKNKVQVVTQALQASGFIIEAKQNQAEWVLLVYHKRSE